MAGIRALHLLASLSKVTGVRFLESVMDTQIYAIPTPPLAHAGDIDEAGQQWRNGFLLDQSATSPSVDLYEISSCFVTPNAAILTKSGDIVEESLFPYVRLGDVASAFKPFLLAEEGAHPEELSMLVRNVTSYSDTLLFGREHGEMGYFHWIHSIIPRVAILRDRFPEHKTLIALTETFQRQSLERLSVTVNDIEIADGNTCQCERLIYCTPMVRPDLEKSGGFFERSVVASSSLHSLRHVGEPRRRIIISRRDASIRRLIEEDELLMKLEPYGFEAIVLTTLSFADQVRLFSTAEIVVGSHGAGLSNIAFMPEGSQVLELLSPNRLWPTYRGVAARSGVIYIPYVCRQGGAVSDSDSDLRVDPDHLAEFVLRAISR